LLINAWQVLLCVIASVATGRAGAAETAKFSLDTLEIITLHPSSLTETCLEEVGDHRTGVQILLETASGLVQRDADVMKGALKVLRNCIHLPHPKGVSRQTSAGGGAAAVALSANAETATPEELVRRSICQCIRKENGIKILVSLLRYRRCIQAADEVRMLATAVLSALAQDPQIAQILEKMRLSLVLSEVVRAGPVMERSSVHYKTLRAAATQLIARITGRPTSTVSHSEAMDPAAWKLEKAGIVARTPISYDSRELLVLIRDHLLSEGLYKAARTLEDEAELSFQRQPSTFGSPSVSRNISSEPVVTEGTASASESILAAESARKKPRSSLGEPVEAATVKATATVPKQQPGTNVRSSTSAPAPSSSDNFMSPTPLIKRASSDLNPSALASSTKSHRPSNSTTTHAVSSSPSSSSTKEAGRSSSRLSSRLFPVGLNFRRRSSMSRASLQTPSLIDAISPEKLVGTAADSLDGDTPIPTSHILKLQTPIRSAPSSMVDTDTYKGPSTTLDQIVVQYLR